MRKLLTRIAVAAGIAWASAWQPTVASAHRSSRSDCEYFDYGNRYCYKCPSHHGGWYTYCGWYDRYDRYQRHDRDRWSDHHDHHDSHMHRR